MKKSLLIGLVAGLSALSASAQEFTVDKVTYTVLDADAKTVTTKAGTGYGSAGVTLNNRNKNSAPDLVIPEKVTDPSSSIEYTVTEIGYSSFTNYNYNNYVSSITLPATITSIGQYAFAYCDATTQVTILAPEPPTIGGSAFSDIASKTLVVPKGSRAAYQQVSYFSSWTIYEEGDKVIPMDFQSGDLWYSIISQSEKTVKLKADRTINVEGGTSLGIGNNSASGDIVIPETLEYFDDIYTVVEIGEGSFFYDTDITSITIPGTVELIDYAAFAYCSGLKSVTLNDGLYIIGDYAFYYNFDDDNSTGLSGVELPSTLEMLGTQSFAYDEGLTSIVLPASLGVIGDGTFWGCTSLKSVTCFVEQPLTFTADEYLFPVDLCPLYLPKNYIENYKSQDKSSYTSWTYYFTDIEPITFVENGISYTVLNADQVETTEGYIYEGYYYAGDTNAALKGDITIPATVTYDGNDYTVIGIGDGSFAACEQLTGVALPETITYIGESAFDFSTISSINLPDALQTIGAYAFYDTYLTSISIPGSVKVISEGAFDYCGDLTSVTLNEGLTTIGAYAFEDTIFTTVVLPSSLTSIGAQAFAATDPNDYETVVTRDFTSVTSYATTAPACGEDAFYMYNWCALYVPAASVESYTSANVWKNFTISALGWSPATAENFDVEANIEDDVITIVITSEDCTEFAVVGEKVTIAGNTVNVTSAQVSGEEKNVLTISVAVPEDAEEGAELAITVPAGFFTCTYDGQTSESPALNATVEVPETDDNNGSGDNNGDDNNGDDNNGDDNNGDDNMGSSAVDSILTEGHDVIYNLQGVRVDSNKLTRGIYIINGKKVMVK